MKKLVAILLAALFLGCSFAMAEDIEPAATECVAVESQPTAAPVKPEPIETAAPVVTAEPIATAEPVVTIEPCEEDTAEEIIEETEAMDTIEEVEEVQEIEEVEEVEEIEIARSIEIVVLTDGTPALGETVTLQAKLNGYEGLALTMIWQMNDGNGWSDIDGANATEYSFTLNESNNGASFRLVVNVA